MALIKCPECGRKVSDKAKTCPDCGYPIAANNSSGTVTIKIANGIAGTVKIFNVGSHDELLWQGKAGQVATFDIEKETIIDITWGLNHNPSLFSERATKVKGNEKYELAWQKGFMVQSLVINRVDVIDAGR